MIRYLRAAGGAVIGIAVNTIRFIQLLWYLGVVLFAAILVYDLFRIPVSVNNSWKYAPEQTLWRSMAPEEEARLKEYQEHCRHIYKHNTFDNYYCPICRQKLTKDRPYFWRI